MHKIFFTKNHPDAKVPKKKSNSAAAFDLYAVEDVILHGLKPAIVRTGLKMEIPEGYKGEIYSRSGLAAKGITIVNQPGKIDSDYRGEIKVIMMFLSDSHECYAIKAGDRIAQFEIQKVEPVEFSDVKGRLSSTDRGKGGFGSTGR